MNPKKSTQERLDNARIDDIVQRFVARHHRPELPPAERMPHRQKTPSHVAISHKASERPVFTAD